MEGESEPEKPPRRARRPAETPRKSIDEAAAEVQANAGRKRSAKPARRPPNATERFIALIERQLEDACRERDGLRAEMVEFRSDHSLAIAQLVEKHETRLADSQQRLLDLEPRYEGLRRDYANLLSINAFNLVLTAVGAVLVSAAGYAPNRASTLIILAVGCSMFVIGVVQQIWAAWRNRNVPLEARRRLPEPPAGR